MGAVPDVPALNEEELEGCIRCYPGDEEGTMGFFVCGFIRNSEADEDLRQPSNSNVDAQDDWEGFSD